MVIVRAPVRVSFGGGGTDLAAYYGRFGGLVVSATISRYAYVTARRPDDAGIRINSIDYRRWESFPRGRVPEVSEPLVLPKAAVEWFADRGLRESGVDLTLASEVPPGTGLGSSSAMAVALAQALACYLEAPMAPDAAADLASRIEIERLEMPIGKQDQYASACGGLNAIEFTADGVRVEPLDLPADVIAALGARLMLFSTGTSRHSSRILTEQRTNTETKPAVLRSLHRLKALAAEMREALTAQDLDLFGELLDRGWQVKKRLSSGVSTTEIDDIYAAARAAGALGGKITGAGGGGFLLLYCPRRRQRAVRTAMERRGLRELAFDFDFDGVRVMSAAEDAAGRIAEAVVSD